MIFTAGLRRGLRGVRSIAVLCRTSNRRGRAHCQQIVVPHGSYVGGREGQERLRATGGGDELDLKCLIPVHVDHCPEIPGPKPGLRDVPDEYDRVEFAEERRHGSAPGYAVTNRGKSSPVKTIQTATTPAARPDGPVIVPWTRYFCPNLVALSELRLQTGEEVQSVSQIHPVVLVEPEL